MATNTNLVSKDAFTRLTKQAVLVLKPDEQTSIRSQLNEALSAIKVFDELNTKDVPPLVQPLVDLSNVTREDHVEPSLTQELALSQANKTHNGYFVVNAILDNVDN